MDRDRNLLFGIFAVQLKKVTPTQLMEVAGAWAVEPARDLSQRLVEADYLSEGDRKVLAGFVDQAVGEHGGDAVAALETFGGEEQVHQTYRGSIVMTGSGGVSRAEDQAGRLVELDSESVPAVQETPGRYTHLGEHAHGGMGRILLVHDQHLGRDVAFKELLPGAVPPSGEGEESPVRLSVPFVARFLQEARITGQLEHPSIVPVYELGHRKDGTLYYTMKLVRGKTLREAIRSADSFEERLGLLSHFVDLCQAIAYAHSRGVLHRDIKPDNVMVGEFGETVVLDWGLAKVKDRRDVHADGFAETLRMMDLGEEAGVERTVHGQAIGTPVYMPPEQAKGQLEEVDERSDVYSLGAVLYELLTGKTPFDGESLDEILRQAVKDEPKPIREIASRAPPELMSICDRAMRKEPTQRYQSAREFAEDIERFQSGAFVSTYEYGRVERVRRFVRRHQGTLSVGAVAVSLVAMLGGAYVVSSLQAREESRRRVSESQLAYDRGIWLAQERIDEGQLEEALRTLEAASKENRNWEWDYLVALAKREVASIKIEGMLGTSGPRAFSSDGTRFLLLDNGVVTVRDIESGKPVKTFPDLEKPVRTAEYSVDGDHVLALGIDNSVTVLDSATDGPILSLNVGGPPVEQVMLSPNANYLFVRFQDSPPAIWDMRTGKERVFGPFGAETELDIHFSACPFSPDDLRIVLTHGLPEQRTACTPVASVWDLATGEEDVRIVVSIRSTAPFGAPIAVFSPDNRFFVTLHEVGMFLWSAQDGSRLDWDRARCDFRNDQFAAFSPDTTRLLSFSRQTVTVADLDTSGKSITFFHGAGRIGQASFSPDGKRILTVHDNNIAKLWDADNGVEISVFECVAAAFDPSGTMLLTSTEDGITTMRKPASQRHLEIARGEQ